MNSNKRFGIVRFFLVCAMCSVCGFALAIEAESSYTDRIYLKNGDRITGNIKELDRGKLRVNTRTMDSVYLNWVDVESIESKKYLRIEKTDGSFIYGRPERIEQQASVGIMDNGRLVSVTTESVAAVKPLRVNESFWARLEGDIKSGLDYRKATDMVNLNLASNIRLREETYEIGFGFDWNETQRNEDNTASRVNIFTDYTRSRANRWFWRATAGLERNDELGLKLRTLGAGTIGKYFVQTSTLRFEVNAGLAANLEEKTDGVRVNSGEGLVRSSFDIFVLNVPTTRLTAAANVFPSLTESGRVRANTSITLRNEFIRDLFWDLQFYSNYDNRPAEGAAKEDYGFNTSIGYSF